jgi:hypothetical protein
VCTTIVGEKRQFSKDYKRIFLSQSAGSHACGYNYNYIINACMFVNINALINASHYSLFDCIYFQVYIHSICFAIQSFDVNRFTKMNLSE